MTFTWADTLEVLWFSSDAMTLSQFYFVSMKFTAHLHLSLAHIISPSYAETIKKKKIISQFCSITLRMLNEAKLLLQVFCMLGQKNATKRLKLEASTQTLSSLSHTLFAFPRSRPNEQTWQSTHNRSTEFWNGPHCLVSMCLDNWSM